MRDCESALKTNSESREEKEACVRERQRVIERKNFVVTQTFSTFVNVSYECVLMASVLTCSMFCGCLCTIMGTHHKDAIRKREMKHLGIHG